MSNVTPGRTVFLGNKYEFDTPSGPAPDQYASEADLCFFYGGDHKTVITPHPPPDLFLEDVVNILEWTSIERVSPQICTASISSDVLTDDSCLRAFKKATLIGPLRIKAHGVTSGFMEFIDRLRKWGFQLDESAVPVAGTYRNFSSYESKTGARDLFRHLQITVPSGRTCHNIAELAQKLHDNSTSGLTSVVKENQGIAGSGIHFITPGQEIDGELLQHWPVVCEEFITSRNPTDIIYPTYNGMITDSCHDHGRGIATQIVDRAFFLGNIVSPESVPRSLRDKLGGIGEIVGDHLFQRGYRGPYNIDFIARGGELYATEINLRYSSSAAVFEVGQALFDPGWQEHKAFVTSETVLVGPSISDYRDVRRIMERFPRAGRDNPEGAIVTKVSSMPRKRQVAVFAYANSTKGAESLLTNIKASLGRC